MTRQEALERRDWVLYNLGGERDKDGNWHSAVVYGMRKVTHWMRMPEGPEET